MSKRPRIVRLSPRHVRIASVTAVLVAVCWWVGQVISDGWHTRTMLVTAGYFVFLIVGLTWTTWHSDNKDTYELRTIRRVHAVHAKRRRNV